MGKITEFRMYYKNLAQALWLRDNLSDITFKLVNLNTKRRVKNRRQNSGLDQILRLNTPSILITSTLSSKEIPSVIVQLTEQVTTEDHEWQRFPGLMAAFLAECFYIKVSPSSRTTSDAGVGKINVKDSFEMVYSNLQYLAFHINWPTEGNFLFRDDLYPTCPPMNHVDVLPIFEVIEAILKNLNSPILAYSSIIDRINNLNFIDTWMKSLVKTEYNPLKHLTNSRRKKYCQDSNEIIIKINRFGHSADPEKGGIVYHAVKYPEYKVINRWYGENGRHDSDSKAEIISRFLNVSGFPREIKEPILHGIQTDQTTLDITDELIEKLTDMNQVVFILFSFSDSIEIRRRTDINGDELLFKLIWSRYRLLKISSVKKFRKPIKLKKVEDSMSYTQDELNYIISNNIFKDLLNCEFLSCSTPKAQGSLRILDSSEKGLERSKYYIDVIAKVKDQIYLIEIDSNYTSLSIKEDIYKLTEIKNHRRHDLAEALDRGFNYKLLPSDEIVICIVGNWPKKSKEEFLKYCFSEGIDIVFRSSEKGLYFHRSTKTKKVKVKLPERYSVHNIKRKKTKKE